MFVHQILLMTKAKKEKYEMTFGGMGPTMSKYANQLSLHRKGSLVLKAHISQPVYIADFPDLERW